MSSAMAPSECHGSNYKWDNGIFTPSFNREGEVASIPLPQREEKRQAFSKEGGAGKQGGTDYHQSREKVCQELSCTTGGCQFVTPAMELALALQYIKFHQEDVLTQKEQVKAN